MTTTAQPATALQDAFDFFAPLHLWSEPASPEMRAALVAAGPVKPNPTSVFKSGDDGLVTCILAEEKVGPELQAQLDAQKKNLIDLCGVSSAYVRTHADLAKNPNLVYQTHIWQEVFNHLPLMGPSQFTRQTYDETMYGVEVATSFIEMILGFATADGAAALAGFSSFLQGLGGSIRAGMHKTSKSFSTAAITIVLKTQKIGSETQLVPMIKAYFIDFTESQSNVYSSCGSAHKYRMQFDYRVAESVFNFQALDDQDMADSFTTFIRGTQQDDVQNATNFFGTSTSKKATP